MADQSTPEPKVFNRRKLLMWAAIGAAGALAALMLKRGVPGLSSRKRPDPSDLPEEDSIFRPRDPRA